MSKNSTSQLQQTVKEKPQVSSPRRSTVEFLRQFARAYTFDRRLAPTIGGLVAN